MNTNKECIQSALNDLKPSEIITYEHLIKHNVKHVNLIKRKVFNNKVEDLIILGMGNSLTPIHSEQRKKIEKVLLDNKKIGYEDIKYWKDIKSEILNTYIDDIKTNNCNSNILIYAIDRHKCSIYSICNSCYSLLPIGSFFKSHYQGFDYYEVETSCCTLCEIYKEYLNSNPKSHIRKKLSFPENFRDMFIESTIDEQNHIIKDMKKMSDDLNNIQSMRLDTNRTLKKLLTIARKEMSSLTFEYFIKTHIKNIP